MFQMCWKKWFFIFLILPICFSIQTSFAQNAPEITSLELNKSIERKISGNIEVQNYQILLSEDQYAKIIIEQIGVDVSAKLFDAGGKLLNSFDNELRLKQNETIEFIAQTAGNYKIEIKTTSKAWAGNYKITLTETREANERDRLFDEVQNLIEKAETARNKEDFDEAFSDYERALKIAEDQFLTLRGRTFIGLIETNLDKGDYPAALIWLERTDVFNKKNLGANHPQTALTTFLRGRYFLLIGDRASADRNYRQALTAYENVLGGEHPILFDTLLKLSGLYISQDDLDGAVVYLQRAEKIVEKHYGADHKLMAGIVNNLGVVFMSKNENDTAEKYFLRVLAIGEKVGEIHQYRYSLTTQNLAVIYFNKKDYARSLEFYERTLKMREEILGGEHLQVGWALYGISGVYNAMGNRAKALETLRRAREIAEKSVGFYNSLTTITLRRTATILAAQGKIEEAVALQKLHDERYEKFFASEMSIGSERQKLLAVKKMDFLTSDTISLHLSAARNNQTALDIAALAVLQRKGRVFDAVADNLKAIRERADEKDRTLLDRFNEINSQIAKLTLSKPSKMPTVEYEKQIAELERKKEQIEVEIGDRNANFPVQTLAVTLDAIKAEIPNDAALVEFAIYLPLDYVSKNKDDGYGKPRYIAYILRKSGDVKFVELGDKKAVDKTIEDLRNALRDPKRKDVKKLARAADEKIMKPIRAQLGNASQIFVSPDGDLNLIPFEALIDEKGKYLVENYSFDYLTSGRDLLRLKTARTSKSESLIIANPLFGSVSGKPDENGDRQKSVTATRNLSDTYFAPLAGTEQEARSIQTLFPNSSLYTEAKATETALKEMNAPRILHIATHGFFLENTGELSSETDSAKRGSNEPAEIENPLLRSGLAFAGANLREAGGKTDDGILTALEASGLNLWGTKLVVLSACDTGIGDVKNGEGVYGLRRAFMLAGTESLVMSLWSVSDYSTRELMTGYYKNLKNGDGRAAALRKVKLKMMKKSGREHPFYWAAFIQTGEWANLDGKR